MPAAFETTIQKTTEILNEIEEHYGWEDRPDQAYSAFRTVLQTLRDRLPPKVAIEFAAELPTLVRGFYFEGWIPDETPKKMTKEEFLTEVRRRFRFSVDGDMRHLVRLVFGALHRHIDAAAVNKARAVLPPDYSELLS